MRAFLNLATVLRFSLGCLVVGFVGGLWLGAGLVR